MIKFKGKWLKEAGVKGRKNRWAKYTPKQRSEQMRALAFIRHNKIKK